MDRRGKGQSIVQSAEAATDPYEIQYKVIERGIFTVSLCLLSISVWNCLDLFRFHNCAYFDGKMWFIATKDVE